MNGYQRIKAALEGEQPDTVPVILHNFMMAAREYGVSMHQFRTDPALIANSFIESIEKYVCDGVLVDVDTAVLAEAVGVPVDLPENEPARCISGCIDDLKSVLDLDPPNVGEHPRVQTWLEAVRLLKEHFGDEVLIRGNCDQCPFSLASMMRSPGAWMMDLLDEENREYVLLLLEHCTRATLQFLELMAETGAHVVSNGDSPAGPDLISPDTYRQFALPYEQKVVSRAHELGLPHVLHICGDVAPILESMLLSGADGFDIDYKTDPIQARAAIQGKATFFGNIDPSGVLARGSSDLVAQKTRELIEIFRGESRFVLNSGCAIPPSTPSQNIQVMLETARACF
jgi:uroporphyrinogen decarboxylase